MTICVAIGVNDCLVFAADSASTLQGVNSIGESEIINVYEHGDKVYNLYKGLPVVAMTCGMGNIGPYSIANLAKILRKRLSGNDPEWHIDVDNYSIGDIAFKSRKYFFEERFLSLDPIPPNPHSFEFYIGGYPSGEDSMHEIWKVSIVNGVCPDPICMTPPGWSGALWAGQPGPINRLLTGFDHRLTDVLAEGGLAEPQLSAFVGHCRDRLSVSLVLPGMPVRDAIALAGYLVDVTTGYFRFAPGADIVGGETDVAVVTRFEGFKWVRRKHYYPSSLNPMETDHVR